MAWIESHQSLLTHRKTGRLSRLLGVSKITAIGHLHAFWWWCLDNAQDGILDRCDAEDVADGACWEGDPAAFVAALIAAGFVDELDGHQLVHEWSDYAGRLIEQRRSNAERQRNWRERHRENVGMASRNPHVTVTSPSRNGATGQDHTEDPLRGLVPAAAAPPVLPPRSRSAGDSDVSPVGEPPAGAGTAAPEPAPNGKPPKLKPIYGEDSVPMQLARTLAVGIHRNKPDAKLPRDGFQEWAREFDLMLRVDHRPREKIDAVIAYAMASTFWRRVIFSARKIREKFDVIDAQRQEDASGYPRRQASGNGTPRRSYWGGTSGGYGSSADRPDITSRAYYEAAARRLGQGAIREADGDDGSAETAPAVSRVARG